ncbi:MarR family transcriptional regulator [Aminipila butyrica]|uniref:MarR family transcriptional regulator n=1 Tax=Aminipila butyrica TaxID=433296 RepID=A0A858BXL0_9FIRM|nr:MarR family transcriptional regulator [Aminipila butyrica]QIB70162.1 MarR family transcriptional regulator [Aminipila butyrica]
MDTKKQEENPLVESAEQIARLLKTARKELGDYTFEKARQFGFTGPQLFLAFVLQKHPGLSLQELSDKLSLSKSTVSGMVDRLVGQGDVIREIAPGDRRSVKIFLSPDFAQRHNLLEIKRQLMTDLIRNVPEEDLELVTKGLEKICQIVQKAKSESEPELK